VRSLSSARSFAEVAPGPFAEVAPAPFAEVAPFPFAEAGPFPFAEVAPSPFAEVAPDGGAVRASLEADAGGVDPATLSTNSRLTHRWGLRTASRAEFDGVSCWCRWPRDGGGVVPGPFAEVAPDGGAVRASLEADAGGVDPATRSTNSRPTPRWGLRYGVEGGVRRRVVPGPFAEVAPGAEHPGESRSRRRRRRSRNPQHE